MMVFLLLVVLTIILLRIKKGKIYLDHVLMFTAGVTYYWILPFFVPLYFELHPAFYSIMASKNLIHSSDLIRLKGVMILLLLSFVFGSLLASKWKNKKYIVKNNQQLLFKILVSLTILIGFYFIFTARHLFFKGYQTTYDTLSRGQFVSYTILLFLVVLIIKSSELKINRTLYRYLVFMFIALLVLNLSMGTRLYVLSFIVIYLVFYSLKHDGFSLHIIVFALIAFLIIFSMVGILRSGETSVSIKSLLFIFFAEPTFISESMWTFVSNNELELFKLPVSLLTEFINIIPSAILPNKLDFSISLADLGVSYYAPYGGLNNIVSLIGNFGVIGSTIVLFCFSFFLQKIKMKNYWYTQVAYSMISGWIVFTFFRDGFSVSIVKNIFQYSLLFPIIILITNRFIVSLKFDTSKFN